MTPKAGLIRVSQYRDAAADADTPQGAAPFWKKPLEASRKSEWESLCDGCGRCCLVKLEDEDTGGIHFTDVGCQLLEAALPMHRLRPPARRVPDCVKLTPRTSSHNSLAAADLRLSAIAEGRDLDWWHPLVSGSRERA